MKFKTKTEVAAIATIQSIKGLEDLVYKGGILTEEIINRLINSKNILDNTIELVTNINNEKELA